MEKAIREVGVALSSSINEFHQERLELGDFIRRLNQTVYATRRLHLDWHVCEDESSAIVHGRRQDVFNDKIRASRFFFLLAGKDIGDFTREEFDLAFSLFDASRNHPDPAARDLPKIHPFFKSLPPKDRTERLAAFRKHIHDTLKQYSYEYAHLSELELRMLLEFSRDDVLGGKVTVEDEQARFDGQSVLDVEHVRAYENHPLLPGLRKRRAKLDRELAALTVRCHADRSDREAATERLLVSEERSRVQDRIRSIEKEVLDTFTLLASLDRDRLTDRARDAAELLNAGRYEEARALLQSIDSPEVRADWEMADQITDTGEEQIRALIAENRLRIRALRTEGIDRETLPELTACYEKSANAAKKYHMEPDAVYDYASFLEDQCDYAKAIDLCKWLEAHYRQEDPGAYERANLWNLMGICYAESRIFQEGETCYRKALDAYRALAHRNPDAYASAVAATCNNLGALLYNLRRFDDAEPLCIEALDNYRALADRNPDAYAPDVAAICNNLGALLYSLRRFDDAEPLCIEALEIRRALADRNPDAYAPDVAATCNNLGALLYSLRRFDDAEPLYIEALDNYRALADRNPDAYAPDVAMTCNNLGTLLSDLRRFDDAEPLYREALDNYRALADRNPDAYAPDVAMTCNNLGTLLSDLRRFDDAEPLYREALEIRRALADRNPDAYAPDVADTCNNLGSLLSDLRRFDDAESLYIEALEIRRALADHNPNAYAPDVAGTCNNLGNLLSDLRRFDDAESLYIEALEIRRALAAEDPNAYGYDLATTCFNLGAFELQCRDNPTASKAFFEEALSIFEQYPYLAKDAEQTRRILKDYF